VCVIRAFVLYDEEPPADEYVRHVELCRAVPGAEAFRHGRVFASPFGEPPYRYYAEWEFADMDAFKAASRSSEFAASGKDAMEMGGRFKVLFAEIEGAG
jgi:hypothetical protein